MPARTRRSTPGGRAQQTGTSARRRDSAVVVSLRRIALLGSALALAACATTGARTTPLSARRFEGFVQEGEASFYSDSLAGNHTASGVPYDPEALTAAHRALPFGTVLRVTRVDNGRSIEVVVNDRGPFAGHDRIIDLSRRAARALQMEHRGVARVRIEALSVGVGRRHP
jgi:rare lipoprotein A